MVLGFLSLKGGLAAGVSKAAIGVAVLAGISGAAIHFIPAQADDDAIWFDRPTMNQTLYSGQIGLTVHVGRGRVPSQIRIDVKAMDFPDQPGVTLATKDIAMLASPPNASPSVPSGLYTATLDWSASPGKYKLLPSFNGTKGKYVIVTVAGLPKPIKPLPTPGQSTTPSETPSLDPSETPSIDPSELGPDGGEPLPGEESPGTGQTLPPPPAPVTPPYGLVNQKQINAGTQFTYRFTGSAIVPGSATARVFIRTVGVGSDQFTAYACGPMTADPIDSNKRTCSFDWVSGASNGFPIQVQYYLKVTANGQVFVSPTDSFQAGRALG